MRNHFCRVKLLIASVITMAVLLAGCGNSNNTRRAVDVNADNENAVSQTEEKTVSDSGKDSEGEGTSSAEDKKEKSTSDSETKTDNDDGNDDSLSTKAEGTGDGNEGSEKKAADEVSSKTVDPKYIMQDFKAFIIGDWIVHTDYCDFTTLDENGEKCSYYGDNDGYTISDFFAKVLEVESHRVVNPILDNISYAIIDCSSDKIPELAIKAEFNENGNISTRNYIFKLIGDKLELCYQDYSFMTVFTTLSQNGYICKNYSFGASNYKNEYSVIDADGKYNYLYGEFVSYNGYVILDDRFDSDIVFGPDRSNGVFIKAYDFEEAPDDEEENAKWQQARWYCIEKSEDEASNGIDFDKNTREITQLFEDTGVKLHSLKEVNKKIDSRKAELKLTDKTSKMKDITWNELEIDINAINAAGNPDLAETGSENGNVITIIPGTEDNYKWEGAWYVYITDSESGDKYAFSRDTKLNDDLPCNPADCETMDWISRYLEHSALLDESEPDDPYFCAGVAPGDIWEIEVDENNNILKVKSITYID